jgi:hypothetical protein
VQEGLEMTREIIDECGDLTQGFYIIPSFGRYEVVAQLVSDLLVAA